MTILRAKNLTPLLLLAAVAHATLACGSDSSQPDASASDAADTRPDGAFTNALGQVCDGNHPCPVGNICIAFPFGSQTQGVCGPRCAGDSQVCADGYNGPPSGAPVCDGTLCTIDCNGKPDACPAPLECMPHMESFAWRCVVP